MHYKAEVYQLETEELVADLGYWESEQTAQTVCTAFQRMPLFWEHPWDGMWQARSNVYWYRVIAVTGLR